MHLLNLQKSKVIVSLLKEAQEQEAGNNLGTVGSVIVCATFAGLLLGDENSYLNGKSDWTPAGDSLLKALNDKRESGSKIDRDDKEWKLPAIIRLGESSN